MRRSGQKGMSAIVTLIATAIVISALVYGFNSVLSGRKGTRKMELKNVAENYAAELLETFMAMTNEQLAGYLSRLPAYPQPTSVVIPAYPLCAHVNLMNRGSTPVAGPPAILNADPVAALPINSPLMNSASAKYAENRFYQVTVVDKATLAVNSAACGYPVGVGGGCGVNGGRYEVCPTERFMVTVGVSFVPNGKTEAQVERVVLSSLVDP